MARIWQGTPTANQPSSIIVYAIKIVCLAWFMDSFVCYLLAFKIVYCILWQSFVFIFSEFFFVFFLKTTKRKFSRYNKKKTTSCIFTNFSFFQQHRFLIAPKLMMFLAKFDGTQLRKLMMMMMSTVIARWL